MTIKVGDTVRLIRKRIRTPESSAAPGHRSMTIDLPLEKQKIGLVIENANKTTSQLSVLCGGKMKYWFLKNVTKQEML